MASEKEKQAHSEHKDQDKTARDKSSHAKKDEKQETRSEQREHETHSRSSSHEHTGKSEHEKEPTRSEHRTHDKEHEKAQDNKSENRTSESRTSKSKSSHEARGGEAKLAAGKSARTTDHDVIRRWVEERGGSPAAVIATEHDKDPGMLRINFPGYSGANRLEDISWEDFFKKFDEKNLEFLYQDETRDGNQSRFWKFVSREDKK